MPLLAPRLNQDESVTFEQPRSVVRQNRSVLRYIIGIITAAIAACSPGIFVQKGCEDQKGKKVECLENPKNLCEGVSLDDGIACTEDFCNPETGEIIRIPKDENCPPEACRTIQCDPGQGCVSQPNLSVDGQTCELPETQQGICSNGQCLGKGCETHDDCSDRNPCNGREECTEEGKCIQGTPPSLDDNNPCTVDACAQETGVTHTPVEDGGACDDGLFCTEHESCQNGNCVGQHKTCDDQTACTTDICWEEGEKCLSTPNNVFCQNDNPCDGEELCDPTATSRNEQGCTPAAAPDYCAGSFTVTCPGQTSSYAVINKSNVVVNETHDFCPASDSSTVFALLIETGQRAIAVVESGTISPYDTEQNPHTALFVPFPSALSTTFEVRGKIILPWNSTSDMTNVGVDYTNAFNEGGNQPQILSPESGGGIYKMKNVAAGEKALFIIGKIAP